MNKLNGVDWSSVSEVNDVSASSIAKILSSTSVDYVEIEVYFNDVSGFVSTAEIQNLTLELIVSA